MGSIQSQENIAFILDDYRVVKQQSNMKVLIDKTNQQSFILKEECFVHRNEYDRQFKRLTMQDSNQSSENILKLRKLWSKEHNGLCSNLYKIYSIYEYPQVKLIDQIEARKIENKYFEELQLVSVLQSCMNAMNEEPRYTNLSPYLVFIEPSGLLKIVNHALLDPHHRTIYHPHYFYSPQKFQHFNDQNLQESVALQKESIFNLGLTILHSGLLDSPSRCYELSSKHFNSERLTQLLCKLRQRYSIGFCDIVSNLLSINPHMRYRLEQLQTIVSEQYSDSSMLKSSVKQGMLSISLQPVSNEPFIPENQASLLYSGDTYEKILSPYANNYSNFQKPPKSQFQLLQLSNNVSLPKNHYILSRNKKTKQKNVQKQNSQQMMMNNVRRVAEEELFTKLPLESNANVQNKRQTKDERKGIQSESEASTRNKGKCVFVIESYEDNSKYEGMMQNNLKNGYGKLIYQDGVYFQGNFKNNSIDGKGVLYYGPNRPAYSGDWVNNKFHGKGILYNEFPIVLQGPFDYTNFNNIQDFWIKFQGQFVKDLKQGRGKIYLSNGEIMEGIFSKGLLNGEGNYTTLAGSDIKKLWLNNMAC